MSTFPLNKTPLLLLLFKTYIIKLQKKIIKKNIFNFCSTFYSISVFFLIVSSYLNLQYYYFKEKNCKKLFTIVIDIIYYKYVFLLMNEKIIF